MRVLLRWRLQMALANPDFLRACPPVLRETLQGSLKQQDESFLQPEHEGGSNDPE